MSAPVPPPMGSDQHASTSSWAFSFRGCPFACDFCNVTLFGRRMRTKTTEQWIAELTLYAQGWRGDVFVVDDNFIGNKTLLKDRVLPAMIDWMRRHKRPFKFNTQVSINLADDDELMRLMAEAGFDCVFVGIETANEAGLAECNKTQNIDRDMVDCVRRIQRAGMQVQAGFILGFDSDHASVFDGLIRFIQESGIVSAMVGSLNAPKGTQLYQRLVNENRLLEDGSGDNTDFSMNFVPTMDRDELSTVIERSCRRSMPRAYYQPHQYVHEQIRARRPPRGPFPLVGSAHNRPQHVAHRHTQPRPAVLLEAAGPLAAPSGTAPPEPDVCHLRLPLPPRFQGLIPRVTAPVWHNVTFAGSQANPLSAIYAKCAMQANANCVEPVTSARRFGILLCL